MNWFLGERGKEAPETPVHRWAMNAFKAAIMPETPYQLEQLIDNENTQGIAGSGVGILKTPGQERLRKNINVTFHKSVQTPPKRISRSGLPNNIPGKFPSPWTPKMPVTEEDLRDCFDGNDSPIALEKDTREAAGRANPLKTLTMRLESKSTEISATQSRFGTSKREKPTSSLQSGQNKGLSAEPLSWNIDQGFEEVLASISKNNTYLQHLIDEMQESCMQAEDSFYDGCSTTGTDVTIDMEDPKSRSGQYWRSKFLEFNSLVERIRKEQNNMEKALIKVRENIGDQDERVNIGLQDRYNLLKEEYDNERKLNRNSAATREIRELKKQIRELREGDSTSKQLAKQVEALNLEKADLQSRLDKAKPQSPKSETVETQTRQDSSRVVRNQIQKSTHNMSGIEAPPKQDRVPALVAPQSSTARRIAQAMNKQEAKSDDEVRLSALCRSKTGNTTLLNSSAFRRVERTVLEDLQSKAPLNFTKTFERTGKDLSFSTPPIKAQMNVASPRPKFAQLDVNALMNSSKTTQLVQSAPESDEAYHARREAARRRLVKRKAEKSLQARKSSFNKVNLRTALSAS